LKLKINPGGSSSFFFQQWDRLKKYPVKYSLGQFPEVKIEVARDLVEKIKRGITVGTDPKSVIEANKLIPTLNKVIAEWKDKIMENSKSYRESTREDINNSYRLEWQDIKSCFTDYFCSTGTCNEAPESTASSSKEEYKDDEIEVLLKSKFDCLKSWDIRSLSKRESEVTEEPLTENTTEEAPSSDENTPKEVEAENKAEEKAPSSPKKTEPKAESKPKKDEPAAENKPKKENSSHGGNSKK
jgi:hypothetical protein